MRTDSKETAMRVDIIAKCMTAMRRHRSFVHAAALIIGGMVIGWGVSETVVSNASAVSVWSDTDTIKASTDKTKAALVGTYAVMGTDPDGKPYVTTSMLDISLAPSGALELNWDNGKTLGVGQLNDNVLSVALLVSGRTVVSVMRVNSDGSLSGTWLRRTDRGTRGTETWKRL